MALTNRGLKDNVQLHGSIPYAELRSLGIPLHSIVDFSATVNPHPLPHDIAKLFNAQEIGSYPDNDCYESRLAIARFHEIPLEWTLVSAGLTEIIYALPLLYKRAAYLSPSYGDYAAAFQRNRKTIAAITYRGKDRDFGRTVDKLRSISFRLLFVCNPNNPTGAYLPPRRIEELCELFGHATICIDESYQEMSENCETVLPLITRFRNLLILKSLTKPFGIGGLRTGYAISSGGVLKRLRKTLAPWSVSSLSQKIIPPIFGHYNEFEKSWKMILGEKEALVQDVQNSGIFVEKSPCPFFIARVRKAEEIRRLFLQEYGIAVRECSSFGLKNKLRIMPSYAENNMKLVYALKSLAVDT